MLPGQRDGRSRCICTHGCTVWFSVSAGVVSTNLQVQPISTTVNMRSYPSQFKSKCTYKTSKWPIHRAGDHKVYHQNKTYVKVSESSIQAPGEAFEKKTESTAA